MRTNIWPYCVIALMANLWPYKKKKKKLMALLCNCIAGCKTNSADISLMDKKSSL